MKRQILWAPALALWLAAALVACGGKTLTTTEQTTPSEFEEVAEGSGEVMRLRTYDFEDTLTYNGQVYSYAIHRESDDQLPYVTDEEGQAFADNRYTLTIRQGDNVCFQRQFTKSSFASYLSRDIQEHGILDGMVYDRELPGLCFAVSVSLPQSDMVEPLLVRVDLSGGIMISPDTRNENDFEQ